MSFTTFALGVQDNNGFHFRLLGLASEYQRVTAGNSKKGVNELCFETLKAAECDLRNQQQEVWKASREREKGSEKEMKKRRPTYQYLH